MLRVYGVDLLDLWRGELTPRRLLVLIHGLPTGSNLGLAMGGDAALSDEVTAIRMGVWQICCYIATAAGAWVERAGPGGRYPGHFEGRELVCPAPGIGH